MALANRALFGSRFEENNRPGIEMNVDGSMEVVLPDGSRNPLTGGGGGAVLSASLTLTDAEIKALPTTPLLWVAAPGAGSILMPFWVALAADVTGGDYTNIDAASLLYPASSSGGDSSTINGLDEQATPTVSNLLAPAAVNDPLVYLVPQSGALGALADTPLYLYADNAASGDFTGGHADNSLIATVWYTVADAPA